jgi:hypothetical protein
VEALIRGLGVEDFPLFEPAPKTMLEQPGDLREPMLKGIILSLRTTRPNPPKTRLLKRS